MILLLIVVFFHTGYSEIIKYIEENSVRNEKMRLKSKDLELGFSESRIENIMSKNKNIPIYSFLPFL